MQTKDVQAKQHATSEPASAPATLRTTRPRAGGDAGGDWSASDRRFDLLTLQRSVGNRAVVRLMNPRPAVQRKFNAATVTKKSGLRAKNDKNQLSKSIDPPTTKGERLLVNDDQARALVRKGFLSSETWHPAVNVKPEGPYTADTKTRRGYIGASTVAVNGESFEDLAKARVGALLALGEVDRPWLTGKLSTDDHVTFLMNKLLRADQWVDSDLDNFAEALTTLDEKYQRIEDGAIYVGKVLEHWKTWLYPKHPDQVTLESMRLVKSDLHERGLGVVEVRFKKPANRGCKKFKAEKEVHAFLKPEDKSLEQSLFGSEKTSAVNKINKIAGLKGSSRLQSIRMESTKAEEHGTFVEAARGVETEKIQQQSAKSDHAIAPSFHETMVLAYLAGIDDLHKKNVFFQDPNVQGGGRGVPTLVDADNVMSWSQMNRDKPESSGTFVQSGFSSYNKDEAEKNQKALKGLDNSEINSKILETMISDPTRRNEIIGALVEAITDKRGRVVPIRTQKWGGLLKDWPSMEAAEKQGLLESIATEKWLVRKGRNFSTDYGPGLYGVTGEKAGGGKFRADVEREQIKADFTKGAIPFYEYDFNTGVVTHNGQEIYEGATLREAMNTMLERFHGAEHIAWLKDFNV